MSFRGAVVMYSGKFIKERPKVARNFIQAYGVDPRASRPRRAPADAR